MAEQVKEKWTDKARMKFEAACMDMQSWWRNNKEWAVVVIPVAGAVTVKALNSATRVLNTAIQLHNAKQAAAICWDPSLMIHHQLKHPMSAAEQTDYERLRNQGYSMSEAFNILNLKK